MSSASVYVPTEPLLAKVGSVYKLVILAARRALELSEGAPPLVETDPRRKPSTIALEEIAASKVSIRHPGERRRKEG